MTDVPVRSQNESLGIGSITGDTFSIFFRRFFRVLLLSLLPVLVLVACGALVFARIAVNPRRAQENHRSWTSPGSSSWVWWSSRHIS